MLRLRLSDFEWDIFHLLKVDVDNEWNFMDGTIVKAHQQASGAIKGSEIALGKSRGGATTKIHMAKEAYPEIDLNKLLPHRLEETLLEIKENKYIMRSQYKIRLSQIENSP